MTQSRPTLWRLQQRAAPYLFVLPFLLLFGVFFLYPLANSLVLSGRQFVGPRVSRGVGLGNYAFMLRDVGFWLSVLNTFLFAALFLAVELPLSLGLAVLLNSRRVRFRGVFRFAFFSPYLVGSVFASVIFMLLLTPRSGLINRAIGAVLPWVGSDINWRGQRAAGDAGGGPGGAVALDRAGDDLPPGGPAGGGPRAVRGGGGGRGGPVARFRHVTLPGVRPVLGFLVLAGTIYALQLFELPFVLFQGFGPRSSAMTVVGYLFANGFINQDIGYASAVGWVLVLIISLVAAAQVKGGKDEGGRMRA